MVLKFHDEGMVNFTKDYELNYHLKNQNFRQSQNNREVLRQFAKKIKALTAKDFVTHKELDSYIEQFGAKSLQSLSDTDFGSDKQKKDKKNWFWPLVVFVCVFLFFYLIYG